MFDKPVTEMTLEEIDRMVEEYFDEVDKSELLLDLLSAGFQLEEINFAYFIEFEESKGLERNHKID